MQHPINRPVPRGKIIDWARRNYEAMNGRQVVAGRGIRCDYLPGFIVVHASGSASLDVASSFGFRGFFSTAAGLVGMRLYGGYVDNLLGTHVRVEDTVDTTLDPPVTGTEVPITGGIDSWTRVCVQVEKTTGACSFVALATEPPSSGSYWYRVLHEAYLTAGTGAPVYKMDRRFDWMMGSPI